MIKIEAIFYVVLKINNRRTWEYWPEVLAVRTATTEGQYSPVRPEQARFVNCLLYTPYSQMADTREKTGA